MNWGGERGHLVTILTRMSSLHVELHIADTMSYTKEAKITKFLDQSSKWLR